MTPAEFLDEIVVPTLRECRDERRSRRRAYLACIAVFHIKDHLKEGRREGGSRLRCARSAASGSI